MTISPNLKDRYQIIESDLGPLISESRSTVYDVLEMQNRGCDLYQISEIFNLTPLQVQTAFDYIEVHRERLQPELDEIIRIAEERKRYYYEVTLPKIQEEIAARPMTPQRAAFYALRDKHLAELRANENAANFE